MFLQIHQYIPPHSPIILIPVYHSTFLCDHVFILGGQQDPLDSIASYEIYLCPMFAAYVLEVVTKPFCVTHYHINDVFLIVIGSVTGLGFLVLPFFFIFNLLRAQMT